VSGLANAQVGPGRLLGCPDFATFVCPALVTAGIQGYFNPSDAAKLQHVSVSSYLAKIKVPVLLMQGEGDTLFNLNEAVQTFTKLRAQHTPVSMVWQSWGHSDSTPAPGELDLGAPDPATQYETGRVLDWFDHYLKDMPVSTGPLFAYFRNWVSYSGIATPAYATSNVFPLTGNTKFYLSGDGQLVGSPVAATAGTQTFETPPAGLPTNLTNFDAVGGTLPDYNLPGTYAAWQTPTLTGALDVVGSPLLTVKVSAPLAAVTQAVRPMGELSLIAKIYDVAPDGTASLINSLVAPFRVANVNVPIQVRLPGIVHQFAAGHHVEIMVAGGDLNYRGGLLPTVVTIGGGAGQTLTLPTGS
jgi:ABC-2 type transport system ATP-binding protein